MFVGVGVIVGVGVMATPTSAIFLILLVFQKTCNTFALLVLADGEKYTFTHFELPLFMVTGRLVFVMQLSSVESENGLVDPDVAKPMEFIVKFVTPLLYI